jgi:hypothetical protein
MMAAYQNKIWRRTYTKIPLVRSAWGYLQEKVPEDGRNMLHSPIFQCFSDILTILITFLHMMITN